MHLMLYWSERSNFNNTYSITMKKIHIIVSDLGELGSYGSRFREICMGHNNYTGHRRENRKKNTPIQGPVLKNDKILYFKRYPFNAITQILAEEIINSLTIKASCDPILIDPAI